jgi:hypothetical protein
MAVIKSDVQAPVSLIVAGLSSLASATYVASNVLSHSVNDPLDVLIDVAIATTNTPAGNRQVVIFAKGSLDGSNFGSGPESGTTTTDEPDLHYVGSLPMNTATTTHRKVFSLAAAYGGVLPASTKLVFKNDLGVALTSASVQTSEVWGTAV